MGLSAAASRARQAYAAGDFAALRDLLSASPLELWFGVPTAELAEMFEAIPAEQLRHDPAALLVSTAFFGRGDGLSLDVPEFVAAQEADPTLHRWRVFVDGWTARMNGDPRTAYRLLHDVPQPAVMFPNMVRRTSGFEAFFLGQAALTAALAGEFTEALGLYDRLLLAPPTLGLEFFEREARLRAALLHGLFGDQAAAQIHLRIALSIARTASWAEATLDQEEELVSALLMPDDDAGVACDRVLRLTYRPMGELWPFYIAALQRLSTNSGRRAQMRERVEALQLAGLGTPVGAGFTGSVISQVLALDSLIAGNIPRAREQLEGSDPQHWRTQVVACLLALSSSAPRRAIQLARAMGEQTKALRQADLRRQMVLALAYFLEGEQEAALAIIEAIGPTMTPSELTLAHLLSPALLELAEQHIPGLPRREAPESGGVMDQPHLTAGEIRVLMGLGRGLTRSEIAQELVVSENTIKTQQRTLYRKLGVHTAEQAILHATQRGMI